MSKLEAGVQTVVRHTVGRFSDYPERLVDPGEVFGNIVPVMLDNFHLPTALAERNNASPLTDQLLPQHLRESLVDNTWNWVEGESRGAVITVGSQHSGSAHPHFFEVTATDQGVRLLFVDPEKTVGARNFFKPNVVNLIEATIPSTGSPEFAYLRYSSGFLPSTETHVAAQYLAAETLLETGANPDVLSRHQEEILFRLLLTENQSLLQTRLVLPGQAERFLESGRGHIVLEHRVNELAKIMDFFQQSLHFTGHEAETYIAVIKRVNELKNE